MNTAKSPSTINGRCTMSARLLPASKLLGAVLGILALAVVFSTRSGAQSKVPAPTKSGTKTTSDVLVNSQGAEQVAYINELVEKMWKENKIEPSDRCSDYEFIRRASLD